MERLTGGTVWSRFHAGGFTPDVSCAILLAVCAGLHHAHQHGVLHRDIKPENLMFSGEGTLKVTDLGIAKVVGGSSTLATRAGEVLGNARVHRARTGSGRRADARDRRVPGRHAALRAARRTAPVPGRLRRGHDPVPARARSAAAPAGGRASRSRRARRGDGSIDLDVSARDRYQSAEEFGVAIAHCAAKTWGRGWLARTNVPVSASGPILLAALGELEPAAKLALPTAAESASAARPEPHEPRPG